MRVDVLGWGKRETVEIEESVRFFANILFHPNLQRHLGFHIQKNIESHALGECWPEDDPARNFVIEVRCAKGDDEVCETIAHEMVHAKQWAKGEFGVTYTVVARKGPDDVIALASAPVEIWNGVIWKPEIGEHPYFDAPWEVEAYGKAVGMIQRWRDHKDKKEQHEHNAQASISGSSSLPNIDPNCCYGTDAIIIPDGSETYYYGGA